jgi:hypothetical protein
LNSKSAAAALFLSMSDKLKSQHYMRWTWCDYVARGIKNIEIWEFQNINVE